MTNVVTLDQNGNSQDVLARVKALLEQSTVTRRRLPKRWDLPTTVNQLLNGNYKADLVAMVVKPTG